MLLKNTNIINENIENWSSDEFYNDFIHLFTIAEPFSEYNVFSVILNSIIFITLIVGIFLIVILQFNNFTPLSLIIVTFGIALTFHILIDMGNDSDVIKYDSFEKKLIATNTDEQIITLYNTITAVKLLENELLKEDNTDGLINLYQLTSGKNSKGYFSYNDEINQDDYIKYVLNKKNMNTF